MPKTHYSNLQVSEEASPEVIKASYRALAQKWHPDRNPGNATESESVFKIITSAYEVLSNPTERAKYDAMLREQRGASMLRPPPSRSRHHPAAEAGAPSDYGTDRKNSGAEQSASEPHNAPHSPPTNAAKNNPYLRFVVLVVLAIAFRFFFGDQWTISSLFARFFGM
jgi:curved DNA-binding protein CbpA